MPAKFRRRNDGRAHIYDYKSGRPPSDKEIEAFDKQLPLTAALSCFTDAWTPPWMRDRGAFIAATLRSAGRP